MGSPEDGKLVVVKGETIKMFYIGSLAQAVGRTPTCVRAWEIAGRIPKTVFKDKNGRRLYTKEHINATVRIATQEKIFQGARFCRTHFVERLAKEFEKINKKYI